MKTLQLLAVVVFLAVGVGSAMAETDGSSSTAEAAATADVIAPIELTAVGTGMSFGSFVKGAGTVDTTGTNTTLPMVPKTGNTPTGASFDVTGEQGYLYQITSNSDATVVLTDSVSSGTMTATLGYPTDLSGRTLDASGKDSFDVEGLLTVEADDAPGTYTGTFSVEVAYE